MGRLLCEAAVAQLATEDGDHVMFTGICGIHLRERGVVRATRCGRYVAAVASGRFCEQGQLDS